MYNDKAIRLLRKTLRRDQTDAERAIWNTIRNRQIQGLKFYRQYSAGPYILDFYCPQLRLGIEVDGGQHNEEEGLKRDENRTKYLAEHEIKVLRFWNNDVLQNIEGAVEEIIKEITHPLPSLTLREGSNDNSSP